MQKEKSQLNEFLVEMFNRILAIEETSLSKGEFKNLSVREMHVIEAVVNSGENNTSKEIAQKLDVTQSTLTTAVTTLEKKGLLIRKSGEKDKRKVRIYATDLAMKAYELHMQFHEELVDAVVTQLTQQEIEIFAQSLMKINNFFLDKNALK